MNVRSLAFCSSAAVVAASLPAQSAWSVPVPETVLNSTAADSGPHLSFDGLTVWFSSPRSGGTNWEIYRATRPFVGAPWSAPVLEPSCSDPAVDDQPFAAFGDLELYFSSTRAGGAGGSDIMRCTRTSPALPWGPPGFVTELNSAGADAGFSLTLDGLEAYFLTTGWGVVGTANQIARATRTSPAVPFGTPVLVPELAGATHRDCEIALDGLSIAYTESTATGVKVFVATRPDRVSPFSTPVVVSDFDVVGVNIFGFTRSFAGDEAILAAAFPVAGGGQELLNTRRTLYHGIGCGGAAPLALAAPAPVIGAAWDLTTTNVDAVSPVAFTFFGTTAVQLPLDPFGAIGCSALTDATLGALTAVNAGGTSLLTIPVPANPALGGFVLTAQSACLTLGNAFNLYTSNGTRSLFGF
jgi:hypothetical protein